MLKTNSRLFAGGPAPILLAGLFGARTVRHPDRARGAAAKVQIAIFTNALEEFYIDTGIYPSTEEGLRVLVRKPINADDDAAWAGPYLREIPKDPWGRDYDYRSPGADGDFDIICYGRDGVEGGDGVNKDITNHNLNER